MSLTLALVATEVIAFDETATRKNHAGTLSKQEEALVEEALVEEALPRVV